METQSHPATAAEFTLPAPPAEFTALRAKLTAALASGPSVARLRRELDASFGGCFQLTLSPRRWPWFIFHNGDRRWPRGGPFPGDEHTSLWLADGQPAVWTSEPGLVDLAATRVFAHFHGLRFAVSEAWSFWHPGHSRLIWWERDRAVACPPAWHAAHPPRVRLSRSALRLKKTLSARKTVTLRCYAEHAERDANGARVFRE